MYSKKANSANFRKGRIKAVEYIVIHYTANNGDTARNNVNYFAKNAVGASANYFVDEKEVCQSVPPSDTAWHCGGKRQGSGGGAYYGKCTNSNSIGIELCSRKDSAGNYYFKEDTVTNAAAFTRSVMAQYNIPASKVIRHYDVTGKICPAPFISAVRWNEFKSLLAERRVEVTMTESELKAYVDARIKEVLNGGDKPVSSSLKAEFELAKKAGITDGTRPGGYATREQCAVMALRAAKE